MSQSRWIMSLPRPEVHPCAQCNHAEPDRATLGEPLCCNVNEFRTCQNIFAEDGVCSDYEWDETIVGIRRVRHAATEREGT